MKHLSILEALEAYEQTSAHLGLERFAAALAVSLVAAFVTAGLYRLFYENRGTGSQISRSFALLSLAITTLFVCIQVSIPLSLGLMGSLSIIRFRTPIKEPEEVGFLLLVIASSVAAATYNFAFLVILYIFAIISLLIMRRVRFARFFKRDGLLVMTLPDTAIGNMEKVTAVLDRHLTRHSVQSAASREENTSLQVTFSGLKTDVGQLQDDLRRSLAVTSVQTYLDPPGGLH